MKLKNINDDLVVACEVYSNSRNWGHRAIVFYRGYEHEAVKITYFNRTWERYQFESVLYKLIDKLDENKKIPPRDRIELYKFVSEASNF